MHRFEAPARDGFTLPRAVIARLESFANDVTSFCRATTASTCFSAIIVFALFAMMLAASTGCSSFKKPPVSQDMVQARQLSIRGMDAIQHGQWNEAEHLYSKAVETCPVNERARAGYAETLWQKDRCSEAIAQMEEAVRLSGGDPELLVRLGEMQLSRGDLDAAEIRSEAALKAQPSLACAWALRGDVQKARGRLDEALLSYHRALGYQEHYPRVQIAASEVYRLQNRPLRALATLDHLSDRYAPGTVPSDILYLRGLAQKALGRYDDAVESLVASSKNGQPTPDMLFQLSEAQLLAGDENAARNTVMDNLSRYPQHVASQRLASQLQSEQQRVSVAGSVLR